MRKVKPAIYFGPLDWGWVDLQELADVLGLTREQAWKNFYPVTWFQENKFWCNEKGDLITTELRFDAGRVFIPAGLSMKILRLHDVGVGAVIFRHDYDTLPGGCVLMDLTGEDAIIALDRSGNPVCVSRRIYKDLNK